MINPSPLAEKSAFPLDVLIVDDEDLIRWSLRKGFTQRGHRVVEAVDGAGALQVVAAAASPFDAVLLDFRLPDRQDLSLLQEIRQSSPSSAVFMMTAFGDAQTRADAIACGARAVIDKPFRVSHLVALVESIERH